VYLKTLTLRGFKSFASATRFEFEPGVTCVVGPNGSGKSNVVDALAWVMGEQGAKTLRGGKMEDVIFAGTQGRAALGRAEVSLTIDNSDGALPIEYSEVTITRTLFRNGGSEYAINGASCRLLDIQDLLSDSGLGREMHVIVGQGQLDAILRATPIERRGFIEEAAGVLKHRKRKEKALRKLDSMQGNLLRLTDLIAELRRQLGPLGRQAQAARKAAVIAAQVRDSGARLLADDLNRTIGKRTDLTRVRDELRERYTELEESSGTLRTRLTSLEQAAQELNPRAQRAADIATTLQSQREQLRSIAQVAAERQRHLGTQSAADSRRGVQDLLDQLARARVALGEATVELEALKTRVVDAEKERTATHEEHARLGRSKEKEQQRRAAHREKVARLGAQVAAQRSRVEVLASNIERLTGEIDEARSRLTELATEDSDVNKRRHIAEQGSAVEQHSTSVHGIATTEQQLGLEQLSSQELDLSERLDALGRESRALRESHLEAERQRATHQARATAHEAALEQALGSARQLAQHDPGLVPLSQHLEVPAEHETAITAALAHLRHALVAHTRDQALAGADTAADLGLAAAVIAYPANSSSSSTEQLNSTVQLSSTAQQWRDRLPAEAVIAADVVRTPQHNHALRETLERIVIAPAHTAPEILNLAPGLTVVTPNGRVTTSEWVVSEPREDALFALQRNLEHERERAEMLAAEVAAHKHRLTVNENELAGVQAQLKATRTSLATAREKQRAEETARARATALRDAANRELERRTTQLAEAAERKRVEETKLESLTQEYEALAATDQSSRDRQESQHGNGNPPDGQEQQADLDTRIAETALVLERVREIETLARLDLRSAQEKHKNLDNRVAGLERALRTEEQAEKAAEEAERRRAAQAATARKVQDRANLLLELIEKSIARAATARDEAHATRDRYAQELDELRSDLFHRDATTRELTEAIHARELELTGLDAQVQALETRAVQEYGQSAQETIDQYGPHLEIPAYEIPKSRLAPDEELPQADLNGVQAFDREYLEKTFERATKALANLGKVNPLALEEYTALEERHKFLADQLADLKKSRADLLGLVDDIDAKVQEVFASAFADTAAQFQRVFPRLFPGGDGRMFLTDPEDMLTTGIEIEARPAGKKVKRLSLLSGGERSLTAIAMLVSIFKARPSPFYVMDEVEAALDDVNLGRLLGVFKELQQDSQLIVITHQKRTMEIADALYGVTMQGDGISAVLSQRLDRDEDASTLSAEHVPSGVVDGAVQGPEYDV
jgi:chromosome segregation protein